MPMYRTLWIVSVYKVSNIVQSIFQEAFPPSCHTHFLQKKKKKVGFGYTRLHQHQSYRYFVVNVVLIYWTLPWNPTKQDEIKMSIGRIKVVLFHLDNIISSLMSYDTKRRKITLSNLERIRSLKEWSLCRSSDKTDIKYSHFSSFFAFICNHLYIGT